MIPTKTLPWLLAGLPIVAVVIYLSVPGHEPGAQQPASSTDSKAPAPKKKPELAEDESRIKKLTPEQQLAADRYREAKERAAAAQERATASFQKLAKIMTPEYCARTADSVFDRRRDKYGKLLDSWNLDADKAREVMDILRSRELRRIQNRAKYFQDPYNPKILKTKTSHDQAEDHVARETLNLSLGESRGNELLNLMTQADADDLKLVEQLIQKKEGHTLTPKRED